MVIYLHRPTLETFSLYMLDDSWFYERFELCINVTLPTSTLASVLPESLSAVPHFAYEKKKRNNLIKTIHNHFNIFINRWWNP